MRDRLESVRDGCVVNVSKHTRPVHVRSRDAGAGGHCVHRHEPNGRYLVDPASSHMLVSKIKPCMSKYRPN